jgi:hypothetical protein
LGKDLLRFAAGLALESAIVHARETKELLSLYLDPEAGRAMKLYKKFAASDHYHDRELAIRLETGLDTQLEIPNPRGLAAEMREMEALLLILIRRVGGTQMELNLWMDYIANAAQFLLDGFWIDAKIMLSRAVDCSLSEAIKALRSKPNLDYQLDMMQKATASYFKEASGYPTRLQFPGKFLGKILGIQRVMLELMIDRYHNAGIEGDVARQISRQLSSAMRYTMEGRKDKAQKELSLALNRIREAENQESLDYYKQKLEDALEDLKD